MKDQQVRDLDSLKRMNNFTAVRAGIFGPGTTGKQLVDFLAEIVEEIENHAVAQAAADGAKRQKTANKETARRTLIQILQTYRRTSRSLASTVPDVENRFRFNQRGSDQTLINEARAIAQEAQALKAEFLKLEMAPDFIETLTAAIDNFVNADREQDTFEGARKAAGAALEGAFGRGMDIRRRLIPIVRNKFADDPATLADWERACRIERPARQKKDGSNNNTNTPPPA